MVLPLLLSAAAGVFGVVGNVISANQAKKADEADRAASIEAAKIPLVTKSNLDVLVQESEAAGFNPLTVLRAGGLSAFSTTTGHNAHLAARGTISSVSPFGEGLQAAGAAISSFQNDMLAQQRAAQEWQLVNAQLANLQADTAMRSQSFGVPMMTGASHVGAGPWAMNEPMKIWGVDIPGNPNFSPAGVITENWGEPAEWLYSPAKIGADIGHTLREWVDTFAPNFLHIPTMLEQGRNNAGVSIPLEPPMKGQLDKTWVLRFPTAAPSFVTGGGF